MKLPKPGAARFLELMRVASELPPGEDLFVEVAFACGLLGLHREALDCAMALPPPTPPLALESDDGAVLVLVGVRNLRERLRALGELQRAATKDHGEPAARAF